MMIIVKVGNFLKRNILSNLTNFSIEKMESDGCKDCKFLKGKSKEVEEFSLINRLKDEKKLTISLVWRGSEGKRRVIELIHNINSWLHSLYEEEKIRGRQNKNKKTVLSLSQVRVEMKKKSMGDKKLVVIWTIVESKKK